MTVTIRAGKPADSEAIVTLVESAYRGDSSRVGWTTEANLLQGRRTGPDEVSRYLDGGDDIMLLLLDGGRLLGCCLLEQPKSPGGAAYFGMFAVVPSEQGAGHGSTLLAAAEARARSWGASLMQMTVLVQRPELLAFYRSRGYAETGATEPFPYGDERFGVPQREDLSFSVLTKPLLTG